MSAALSKIFEVRTAGGDRLQIVATRLLAKNNDHPASRVLTKAGLASDDNFLVSTVRAIGQGQAIVTAEEWSKEDMRAVHRFVEQRWELLRDGQVIDARELPGQFRDPALPDMDIVMDDVEEEATAHE